MFLQSIEQRHSTQVWRVCEGDSSPGLHRRLQKLQVPKRGLPRQLIAVSLHALACATYSFALTTRLGLLLQLLLGGGSSCCALLIGSALVGGCIACTAQLMNGSRHANTLPHRLVEFIQSLTRGSSRSLSLGFSLSCSRGSCGSRSTGGSGSGSRDRGGDGGFSLRRCQLSQHRHCLARLEVEQMQHRGDEPACQWGAGGNSAASATAVGLQAMQAVQQRRLQ